MSLFDPRDTELEKAMSRALGYLSHRERSIHEMETYLTKKEFPTRVVVEVVERLVRMDYLNDKRFAKLFIRSRINSSPRSCYALGCELKQKGIAGKIIQELVSDLNDDELALGAARIKARRWRHLALDLAEKKCMGHLRYRGFGYGASRHAWEGISKELYDE